MKCDKTQMEQDRQKKDKGGSILIKRSIYYENIILNMHPI